VAFVHVFRASLFTPTVPQRCTRFQIPLRDSLYTFELLLHAVFLVFSCALLYPSFDDTAHIDKLQLMRSQSEPSSPGHVAQQQQHAPSAMYALNHLLASYMRQSENVHATPVRTTVVTWDVQ
jgi:hypothetical protein